VQYPVVLSASVTNSGSDMNASSVKWLTLRRCGTPDEWLLPGVAIQGCTAVCEHLVGDFKTLRIPRSSPVFSLPVAPAVSRRAGDHFPDTDLRSSHTGQVTVILSVSDASPLLS